MLGRAAVPMLGMLWKLFGYVGTESPVNVSETMLMPLFEWAVPSMIDGVRPQKIPHPPRATFFLLAGVHAMPRRGPQLFVSASRREVSISAAASCGSGLRT